MAMPGGSCLSARTQRDATKSNVSNFEQPRKLRIVTLQAGIEVALVVL
jgi:hypothetical protein